MGIELPLEMLQQPDDSTCGPTCLHAVYRRFGDLLPLQQVIDEIPPLSTGGTLAVLLACHALRRGYSARIFTYNLAVFDPTWFGEGADLRSLLVRQAQAKAHPKLRLATDAYLDFLDLGGTVQFEELSPGLLRRLLAGGRVVLTGLSATYLYLCAREVGETKLVYDSVAGRPTGHFVVLHGYDEQRHEVHVADPYRENPEFQSHHYSVSVDRLIGAILLGVLTYDANLLVLGPPGEAP